jgi:hypothetical protein
MGTQVLASCIGSVKYFEPLEGRKKAWKENGKEGRRER